MRWFYPITAAVIVVASAAFAGGTEVMSGLGSHRSAHISFIECDTNAPRMSGRRLTAKWQPGETDFIIKEGEHGPWGSPVPSITVRSVYNPVGNWGCWKVTVDRRHKKGFILEYPPAGARQERKGFPYNDWSGGRWVAFKDGGHYLHVDVPHSDNWEPTAINKAEDLCNRLVNECGPWQQ